MRRGWMLNPILVLINVLAVIPYARPLPVDQELGPSLNETKEPRTSLSAAAAAVTAVERPPTPVIVSQTTIVPDEVENATSKIPDERGTEEAVTSTVPVNVLVVHTGAEDEAVTSAKDARDTITDLVEVEVDLGANEAEGDEGEGDDGTFEEDLAGAQQDTTTSSSSSSVDEKERGERASPAFRIKSNPKNEPQETQSKKMRNKLNIEENQKTVRNNKAGVPKLGGGGGGGGGAVEAGTKKKDEPAFTLKNLPEKAPAHADKGVQKVKNGSAKPNADTGIGKQQSPANKQSNNPAKPSPEGSQTPGTSANAPQPQPQPQIKVPAVGPTTGKEQKDDSKGADQGLGTGKGKPDAASPQATPADKGTNTANFKDADKIGPNSDNKGNAKGVTNTPTPQIKDGQLSGAKGVTDNGGTRQGNKDQNGGTNEKRPTTGSTATASETASSVTSEHSSAPVSPPPAHLEPVPVPSSLPHYSPPAYLATPSYAPINLPNFYGKPAQLPLPQPYTYQPDSHYPVYSQPVQMYAPNPGYRPVAPYEYRPNPSAYLPAQPPPAVYSQEHLRYNPTNYRGGPPAVGGYSVPKNPPRGNKYPPNPRPKYRPTPYKPSAPPPPPRTYTKVKEPVPKRRNPYPPNGQHRPYTKPSTSTYTRKPGNQYKPKIYPGTGQYEEPSPVYTPPVNRRPQAKPEYKPDADEYQRPEHPYRNYEDDDTPDDGNIYGYQPYETPKPKKPSMPTKKKIVYPTRVGEPYDESRPYGEDQPAEPEEYEENKYRKTPYGRPSSPLYGDRQPEYRPTYTGEDEDEPYSTKTYPATPYERDPYAQENEYEAPPTYPDGNHEAPVYAEPEPASYTYPAAAPRKQRPPQYSPNRYDRRPPAPTPYREKETYEEDDHGDPYGESGPEHLAPEENDGYARPGWPYGDDEKREGEEYEAEAESPPEPEPEYTETERYRPPYGENRYRPRARSDYIDEGEHASTYGDPTYDANPHPADYYEEEQDVTTYDPPEQYREEEEDPPAPMYNYEEDQSPAADEDEDGEAGYPGEVPYGQVEQIEADEMEQYEQYGEVEQNQYDEPEEGGQDEYSSSGRSLVEAPASSSTVITTQNTDDPGGVIAGNIG